MPGVADLALQKGWSNGPCGHIRAQDAYVVHSFMIIAQIVNQTTNAVTQTGIGLGSAIAVVCSWQRNRSILWAILAGIFSWFYVIYFAVTRQPEETK